VIAYDEIGPIELRPQKGRHWQIQGKPNRVPATYRRPFGVKQLLCAMNFHKGTFFGRLRRRKRWNEVLGFFKELRRHYPVEQPIYIILDNFSPHKKDEVREWANENNVFLVFTPTNASWLNPIECHFEGIRKLAIAGTYHRTWHEMNKALQDALKYKNSHRAEMLENREKRRNRKRLLWRIRK
jgi:transposase